MRNFQKMCKYLIYHSVANPSSSQYRQTIIPEEFLNLADKLTDKIALLHFTEENLIKMQCKW